MTAGDLVVHDAAELVVGPAESPPRDDPDAVLDVRENAAVAVADGAVVAVGPTEAVTREYPPENATRAVDAAGRTVIPGFVDSHTHAAFVGDRSDEFAAKLRGTSYQEILAEGGGILRTVRAVRHASDAGIRDRLHDHLDTMLAHGSTTVEVKSGYGLDTETELRLLDAIDRVDERHPVRVVPTFMGAHAVPERYADVPDGTEAYVDEVVSEQIPAVAEQGIADFCDVFCEEGVFSVAQSRRVLETGRDQGLAPKVHAEEFVRLGGAELAAAVGAVSADHLLHATDEDARALADAGVVPALLPGTAFALGTDYADPRPFLEAGADVAVASDFNPNCHAPGMAFAATLACVGMGLSPAEAVRATTYAGGLALGAARDDVDAVPDGVGTLRPGAPGDLLVLDAPAHAHVPYRFGQNLVEDVVVGGEVVREGDTDGEGVIR